MTPEHRTWQKKPSVRFVEDIRESATYKLIQQIESEGEGSTHSGGEPTVSCEPVYQQSRTIKRLEAALRPAVHEYDEADE